MNKIYIDKDGRVFVNGNEINSVLSISTKTSHLGTSIVLELDGDYKSDYQNERKVRPLDDRTSKNN